MTNRSNYSPRNLLGLALILFGTLFLLDSIGILHHDVFEMMFSFPGAVTLVGLILLINSRNKVLGASMFILGGFMIVLKVFNFAVGGQINFPLILILFGIYIIFRKRDKRHYDEYKNHTNPFEKSASIPDDEIEEVAIFGGGERNFHTQNFLGGSVTAIFGGTKIDLTECKLAPGEQVIDVVAIFGGVEVIVPSNWKVIVDVTPIFGGFSSKWRRDPNMVLDQTSTLRIKGTVVFGGGEVKFH